MRGNERFILRNRCKQIRDAYVGRLTKVHIKLKRPIAPWDTPSAYLKVEVYALARLCRARSWGIWIEKLAAMDAIGKAGRTPKFDHNPFHASLLAVEGPRLSAAQIAMLAHPKCVAQLDPANHSRIVGELQAADRCNVPPEFLIGFIYQAGGYKKCKGWEGREGVPMFDRFARLRDRYPLEGPLPRAAEQEEATSPTQPSLP